ncbi:hypothetical protein GCM10009796_00140 [Microbacterium koreense]
MLSIVAGEKTIAEAARRARVSEHSIDRWKADLLEARSTGPAAGKSGPPRREQQLEAEADELTRALGEAAVEIRVWNNRRRPGTLTPTDARSTPTPVRCCRC